MPEGPEVHYIADRLGALLLDEPLKEVRFHDPVLQRRRRILLGKRVAGIAARGKALLVAVDGGWTLYTHGHLFGFWKLADDIEALAGDSRPRVLLGNVRGVAALYAAPSVSLWRTADLDRQPYLARLGPDLLDPQVDSATLHAQLQAPGFARRSLAVLLLDQGFAAGMGNYLRSEVLFQARLSPSRLAGDLVAAEARRLAEALVDIPRSAYRAKHQTRLPPGKDYLEQVDGGFRFAVYEREGEPCLRCDRTVINERIASRRLYWCPGCQH